MSAEHLDKIVEDFIDQLTSGLEPEVKLDSEGLTGQEREELKLCMDAARRLESAIVENSRQRMSSSGILNLAEDAAETLPADRTPGAEPDQEFAAGQTLGDFEIIREIGRGGMGIVFEAREKSLDRRVALKVLPPGIGWNKTVLERFLREARAAARLQQPHIIPVYHIAQEKGVHYFAMQLIDGFPLSRLARSALAPRSDGALQIPADAAEGEAWPAQLSPPSEPAYYRFVARAIRQAAEGIEYAHQHGILHRDVKPSNLMVDRKGDIWIADFGLARHSSDASVTMSGQLVGTLNYMSPEQALGGKDVGRHSDVYSLGATLYELLTLRTPFVAKSTPELLNDIQDLDPTRPTKVNPRVPVDLEVIALTAMEKQPQHRYISAKEMAADLQRWLEDRPIQARPITVWRHGYKWMRRKRVIVAAGAAILAVVLGASWVTRSATKERGEVVQRLAEVEQQRAEAEQRRAEGEVSTGRMLFEEQDYEAAKQSFTEASKVFSKFLTGTDRLAEAISAPVRVGVEAFPYVYLGLIALRDQSEEAQAHAARQFELALEFAPHDPLLKSLKLLAETEDYDQVQSVIRLIESLPPQQEHGPFVADAFYALGAAVEYYDLQAAIRLTTMAMDHRDAFFEALGFRGWLHYQAGDLQQALADLNNLCIWGKKPEYFIWRGKVQAALGQGTQARADFDRAVELAPDSFVVLAERLIWQGQDLLRKSSPVSRDGEVGSRRLPDTLASQLSTLEGRSPSSYEELYYLGLVYEALGYAQQAADGFRRAVDAVPGGSRGCVIGAAYVKAAQVEVGRGRPDIALAFFNRALRACPHRDFFKARGDFRAEGHDYQNALRDYREAGRRGGTSAELRIATAQTLSTLGSPGECLEELELVLAEEPNHWHALYLKAEVLMARGQALAAIEPLTVLHAAHGGDFRVLDKRAQARLASGDEPGALADWQAAIERGLPVESPEAAMGRFLEGLGRGQEALDAYARALEVDGSLRGPRMARINIYARMGRAAEAIQECHQALCFVADDIGFLLVRAGLYEQLGREDAALEDLRRVLVLRPRHEQAEWDLARLLLYAKDDSLRDTQAVEELVAGKVSPGAELAQSDHRILGHLRYKQGHYGESAAEMSLLGEREVADWLVLAGLRSRGFEVGGVDLNVTLPQGSELTLPTWLRELGDQMQVLQGAAGAEETPAPEAQSDY